MHPSLHTPNPNHRPTQQRACVFVVPQNESVADRPGVLTSPQSRRRRPHLCAGGSGTKEVDKAVESANLNRHMVENATDRAQPNDHRLVNRLAKGDSQRAYADRMFEQVEEHMEKHPFPEDMSNKDLRASASSLPHVPLELSRPTVGMHRCVFNQ